MIKIKDKKDSIIKMKELGLNYFPLDFFSVEDIEGIKNFFEKNPSPEYVLRCTQKAKGQFFFVKNFEEALSLLGNFENEVTVCVSYRPYSEDIILVGDICINRQGDNFTVELTATDEQSGTNRNVYQTPKFNFHASLDDDKVWKVPGFAKVARYISEHELYGVIVEFVLFDCKVGVNKENLVVSEIRTAY